VRSAPLLKAYINGDFVSSNQVFDNINPVDGSLVCQVSEASKEQVDDAVRAAKRALVGDWAEFSVAQRWEMLHKIADRMKEREEEFIRAEIADTGKSLFQVKSIDIPRGTANFRFFADIVRAQTGESIATTTVDGEKAINYTVNKPLGVVAVISPWNLPLLLATWKIAPALACGNAVIVKPSEETPSTMTLLAEVMAEVGVPPGVFNVVHGFGPSSAGEFLTSHPDVDAVTFTGESKTGSQIMKSVAPTVKPISFELGGKNAAIVFEDCDLEKAIAGVARSTFTNCGQVCLCTEKVFVQRKIYDRFVDGLKEAAETITIGRPYDEDVYMGPLVSRKHQEKVLSYFDLAKKEGATTVTGGGIPSFNDSRDDGCFIQPTIFTGLSDDARFNNEEVFGPVCHIAPFDNESEILERVNNSEYGLGACIWTSNLSRAHRLAPKIDTGIVWVNSWYLRDLNTPFGGVKQSGIGREGGKHSLSFYSEPVNICIKIDEE
jgi:aminomuconate-semialdehyde/2-hydroxymuconate-6-semialdehyde dehydrogenase